jgi:hypothetical protein
MFELDGLARAFMTQFGAEIKADCKYKRDFTQLHMDVTENILSSISDGFRVLVTLAN